MVILGPSVISYKGFTKKQFGFSFPIANLTCYQKSGVRCVLFN